LDWYVGYVMRDLRDLGIPEFDAIAVTENATFAPGGESLSLGEVWPLEEYRPRFTDLVTRGWSWVNLHPLGVLAHTLILEVELPGYEPGDAEHTSVNLAGFSGWVSERCYRLDELVEAAGSS
jgi:hypothetical protein